MSLSKILPLIALSLLSLSAFSQATISVTLSDGSSLDCSNSRSIPAACSDTDGNRYIIEANERYASGVRMDAEGAVDFVYMIKEVKVEDQLIFATPELPPGMISPFPGGGGYPGFGGNYTPPDPTHRTEYMMATSAASNLSNIGRYEEITDPAALALLTQMREISSERLARSEAIVNSPTIEAETEDGVKASCESIQDSGDYKCMIHRCQAPLDGFLVETTFGPTQLLQIDGNNRLTNTIEPKRLWSPVDRSKPLFERLDFSGFGMGMSGGIGFPNGGGGYGTGGFIAGGFGGQQMAREAQRMRQQSQRWERQRERQVPTLDLASAGRFSDPMFRSQINGMMQFCNEEQMAPLRAAIDSVRQEVAEAEMVQLVEVTNNFLSSRLINPEAIPENSCRDGDVWYRDQSFELSRDTISSIVPRTIDLATATRLFNEARAMEDIARDYKADGCYARAHLMARRFEEQGINVDKVWIKGDLRVPEAGIQWNFHVAPIVYVEGPDGQVQRMVIDPSLMDGPVPVDEWSAKMQKGVIGETIETRFPFPANVAALERTAIAFSNSDPYLPMEQISTTEEQKMMEAEDTMVRYLGYTQ